MSTHIAKHAFTMNQTNEFSENLSSRLSYALRLSGVSQSELARKIGIKPQTIQYLCTSNAVRSKYTTVIAGTLGINTEWLAAGVGTIMENDTINHDITKVPVISWSDVNNFLSENNGAIKIISYSATTSHIDANCFSLCMNDASMQPRFEIGTILIFEPTKTFQINDFVLVSIKDSNIPIVRQLIKRGKDELALLALNTKLYKEIKLENNGIIIAVLRQTLFEFRS